MSNKSKPTILTSEKINEIMKYSRLERKNKLPDSKIIGQCVVCNSNIKELWRWKDRRGPLVMGPGGGMSKHLAGFACEECGIQYARAPKKKCVKE